MTGKPVAAGKSSLDHVNLELAFSNIVTGMDSVYIDLACGAGRYSLALADRVGKGSVIHAFDLWDEGIAVLRESARESGCDNVRPKVVDATQPLPLEDGSIDVCFMATALHDLPEASREGVVREIHRVLKPQGVFVLIEFKKIDYGPGPQKEKRIGEVDADKLVLPVGFRKDVALSLGEYPYLVRYTKA